MNALTTPCQRIVLHVVAAIISLNIGKMPTSGYELNPVLQEKARILPTQAPYNLRAALQDGENRVPPFTLSHPTTTVLPDDVGRRIVWLSGIRDDGAVQRS
jgi:hypothetical protein